MKNLSSKAFSREMPPSALPEQEPDMRSEKWLFFDVGSTLIDETEALLHRIRETVDGSGVSVAEFTRAANAYYAEGIDGYQAAVNDYALSKTPCHAEDERPYGDAASTLCALKTRGYRLGIIANQTPGLNERLRQWQILSFFDVIAASADCGFSKPDPEIVRYALRNAGCRPENAVMIGDRIDNDLLPAKALGMRTVRILTGPSAVFPYSGDPVDSTVRSLSALLDLFPPLSSY